MRKDWRLITSGYSDAYTNMALDEAIFEEYSKGCALPTLRIYGWKPQAFSLGYFQDARRTLNLEKCAQDNVAFVRRITGGGAIFHGRELTYSLVCSQEDIQADGGVLNSFKRICSFLMAAYKKLGLAPKFAIETPGGYVKENRVVLGDSFCFASREKYDILINNAKIGGNAQKRRKEVIFQHGSIPLRSDIDKAALYLKGQRKTLGNKVCSLEQAIGREIGFQELEAVLTGSFAEAFCRILKREGLNPAEKELSERLRRQKYALPEWNLDRENAYLRKKTALA
ncbi:MAG: lipoate--protein ligase family protein [Candidatus Omnitrophica bacterium]|nr:lipoate--protein ligase family protein [Candidatus Omnitrophota bacterium]